MFTLKQIVEDTYEKPKCFNFSEALRLHIIESVTGVSSKTEADPSYLVLLLLGSGS